MDDEALREGGYPLRPHPTEAPGAFNAWRRAVSIATTIVEPRLRCASELHHGALVTAATETTSNWSGFELRGATGTYRLGDRHVERAERDRRVQHAHLLGVLGRARRRRAS